MNDHQIMIFGRMLASYTRVLGMQAENMQRQQCGVCMAYSETEFGLEADQLELLSRSL